LKKILLISLLASSLFSQTILCYKNNISDSTLNENILLDGNDCQGQYTVNDMKNNGWELDDVKIVKLSSSKYNHIYILKNTTKTNFTQASAPIKKFDLLQKEFIISDVKNNNATIRQGNLKIGQSGIIVHKYTDGNIVVVANATVLATTNNNSILQLSKTTLLEQEALPSTSLKANNNDTFILNHLYNSSLLVVPNFESSVKIQKLYNKQNFVNPDIFAAYLKIENNPVPTKEDFQNFCKQQNIGTLFIVIKNNFYILDVNTFQTLNKTSFLVNDSTTQVPFFTKVDGIKKNILRFWDFSDKKITNYDNYYLSLINNTKYDSNSVDEQYQSSQEQITKGKSILDKVKGWLPW